MTERIGCTLFLLVCAGLLQAQVFDRVRSQEGAVHPEDSLLAPGEALSPPASGAAGEVVFVEGLLNRQPLGSGDWIKALLHSPVGGGDRVRTGRKSRAEIELGRENLLRLAPECVLDVRKLAEESAEQRARTEVFIEQGELWAELEGLDGEASFEISSELVGAAITGTALRFAVDRGEETMVRVYHGEVRLGNSRDALSGGTVRELADLPRLTGAPSPESPHPVEGPRPVEGPHPVAGPHEVSLEEWVVIVRQMQEVRIGADGRVRSAGAFNARDASEDREWVRWNRMRNLQRRGR